MTEGGNSPVVDGGVADLQLDHEITETTRSLGSKSNTQILGLTRDTQIWGICGNHNDFRYG
ncbi:TPA: hypothetical protein HIO18_004223 [Escherichia coli]|nr:hypothetical protein [Escherichia coli]